MAYPQPVQPVPASLPYNAGGAFDSRKVSLLQWILHDHSMLGLCFAKDAPPQIAAGASRAALPTAPAARPDRVSPRSPSQIACGPARRRPVLRRLRATDGAPPRLCLPVCSGGDAHRCHHREHGSSLGGVGALHVGARGDAAHMRRQGAHQPRLAPAGRVPADGTVGATAGRGAATQVRCDRPACSIVAARVPLACSRAW